MEELKEIYYDPAQGLLGVDKLYQKVKHKGYKRKDVADFVRKQSIAQQYRQNPKKNQMPIWSNVDGHWQADLIFYPKLGKFNRGMTVVLTAIELTTKKLEAIPLKNKENAEIKRGFQELLKRTNGGLKMVRLSTDLGSEFTSNVFRQQLIKAQVAHYTAQEGDHTAQGVIERANRTIKQLISRYLTTYKTKVWVDVLHKLVANYNNSRQTAMSATPNQVEKSPQIRSELRQIAKNETILVHAKQDLQRGDRVRVLNRKGLFDKETARWSREIYTIAEDLGKSYTVNGLKGKRFKSYELQRVGAVEENPKQRVAAGFDVHDNLVKARAERGKNPVDRPTGKPQMRQERKTTEVLDIAGHKGKIYKKKLAVEPRQKKRDRKKHDRASLFKVHQFVWPKNGKYRIKRGISKNATFDDPVYFVARIMKMEGSEAELEWWRETEDGTYK